MPWGGSPLENLPILPCVPDRLSGRPVLATPFLSQLGTTRAGSLLRDRARLRSSRASVSSDHSEESRREPCWPDADLASREPDRLPAAASSKHKFGAGAERSGGAEAGTCVSPRAASITPGRPVRSRHPATPARCQHDATPHVVDELLPRDERFSPCSGFAAAASSRVVGVGTTAYMQRYGGRSRRGTCRLCAEEAIRHGGCTHNMRPPR